MEIPDFAQKKTVVVLNELGLYERTKIGPGADSHIVRAMKIFPPNFESRFEDTDKI